MLACRVLRRFRVAGELLPCPWVDAVDHLGAGLGVQTTRLVEADLGIGAEAKLRLLAAEAVAIGPEAVVGVLDAQEKAVAVGVAAGFVGEPLQGAQGQLGHDWSLVLRLSRTGIACGNSHMVRREPGGNRRRGWRAVSPEFRVFSDLSKAWLGNQLGFKRIAGGEGGIRTPGTLARTPHFECGAIDHSATSPRSDGLKRSPQGRRRLTWALIAGKTACVRNKATRQRTWAQAAASTPSHAMCATNGTDSPACRASSGFDALPSSERL